MAKNQLQEGKTIAWTNATGSNVVSGQVVRVGAGTNGLLGVAAVDIANNATGTVYVNRVHTLPKADGATTHDLAQGAFAYWGASAGKFEKAPARWRPATSPATPSSGGRRRAPRRRSRARLTVRPVP
jgi:predicted RecA/RadA family phage recombinase